MSWIEKIKSDLIITTGDSRQFKPLWVKTSKSKEYNVSEFEFPNVTGTLVKRGTPKGRRYNIEIFFQGEDYLDQVESFEKSADDKRPWVISHPLYGSITVQPTTLNFDDSQLNSTKITGTLIETITQDRPKITIDPVDKVKDDKNLLDNIFTDSFDVTPSTTDINAVTSYNQKFYNLGIKAIKLPEEADEYFNLFNDANVAVLDATAEPLAAMRATQALISKPALFSESVKTRIKLLGEQFQILRDTISGITQRSSKKIYENNGGTLISSLALAASTPQDGDYSNKNMVLSVVEELLDHYENYKTDLDTIQSENGGDPESFIPDANSLIALNDLMNFAISNLFTIALNAKQERSVYLEKDSSVILLAHRFYGLLPDDSTIDELIKNNDIGLNELLNIRKGRKIIYYV